jgi:hypothetical protein
LAAGRFQLQVACRRPWLADVIDRALVEEPEIPFKTAAAFKEALEDAL